MKNGTREEADGGKVICCAVQPFHQYHICQGVSARELSAAELHWHCSSDNWALPYVDSMIKICIFSIIYNKQIPEKKACFSP